MNFRDRFLTRRELLQRSGMGMGAVALTALLGESGSLHAATAGTTAMNPMAPKQPPLPAKALSRPRTKRLSAGDGRRGETRTRNPRFWRPVLCQLSYTPSKPVHAASRERMQGRA